MKKKLQKKKGFTLMEMLIVIAIIAILIAIAIPTFSGALEEARMSADKANLRAWYAEVLVDSMLADPPVAFSAADTDVSVVQLQAGTATVTGSSWEDFRVTYTPTNTAHDAVEIPNSYETTTSVSTPTGP